MTIRRRYEDVFSALFLWSNERWSGNHAMASTYTFLALWGAMMMNLSMAIIGARFGLGEQFVRPVLWTVLVGIAVPFTAVNYLWLLRGQRYLEVVEEFARYRPERQRRLRRIGFVYILASFGIALLVGQILAVTVDSLSRGASATFTTFPKETMKPHLDRGSMQHSD